MLPFAVNIRKQFLKKKHESMLALSKSESCRNKITKRMEHFFFFILEFGLNEVNAVDDRQE